MSPPLFCRGGCPHPPAGWRRDGGAGRCGHRPLRSPAYLRSIPLAFFSSMVLISSAICAPAVPRAAGRTGPPSVSFICSGELNSPGIKVLPAGQNACTRDARPVEASVFHRRSMPLAFFSSMVLISSAICAPAVPRAAGRTGPPSVSFICSGELNSPGIKVLPAGQNACTRNARPVEAGGRISPQINAAGLFLQHGLDQLRNVRARLHRGGTLAVDVGDHRALGLRYADVGLVGQVG